MEINKKILISAFSFLSLTLSSCDSFFDVTPYDFVSPTTFYSNEEECNLALTGIYSRLGSDYAYGSLYCMMSNADDLSYYYRNASMSSSKVFSNDYNSSTGDLYNTWSMMYDGINNANVLLENIDKASMNELTRTRIKGEAKFLRAYFHFLLAQMYLDIPLRDKSLSDITSHSLAATSHKQVIDWVINEMEQSVDMVDDSAFDTQVGHVKKDAVMGILARVYLWRAGFPCNGGHDDYVKAAEWGEKVKDANKHKLNPDIYALWKNICGDAYDKEYNESIWEMEATGTRTDGINSDSRIGNTFGNLQLSQDLGYTYAFYAGTLVLWDLYSDNDLRKNLSMAEYYYDKNANKVMWNDNQIVDRRCGKFRREWETLIPRNKNWTPENFPILRYADVLLMIAEAENEANQGPTSLAYECINIVRKRAGIAELNGLSYNEFQKEVRDERGRELCFEATRKYDLIRWGIYVDAIHNKLGAMTNDARWSTEDNASGCKVYCERTSEKNLFFPIPSKELAVNVAIEQNSYWK